MPDSPLSTHTDDPLESLHAHLVESRAELPELRRRAEALRDLPHDVVESLTALLSAGSHEGLKAVSEQSSVHANGFAKIVLHAGGGYGVRLHIWKPSDGLWVPDTQPHGHRWVFASWIMIGALREVVFVEGSGGSAYRRHAYGRDENDRAYLAADGGATLRQVRVVERREGHVYGRQEDILHTATPVGDDLVASLVLQGPHRPDPTPVYSPAGQEPARGEEPIGPDRLQSLLAEVVAALIDR